jgi:putative membrane protein insertion efficiency factor
VKYLGLVLRAFFPSPGVAGAPTCKYHPSCSEYSSLAYREFGLARASLKTAWRLLRCNPWSSGGVDYPGAGSDAGKAGAARPESRGASGAPGRLRA